MIPSLRAAHFQLTGKCNLCCAYCGQARGALASTGGALSLADWLRVAGELATLARAGGNRPEVTLWGGEPLLFPEFDALVERLHADGFRLEIVTNGTLIDRHATVLNRCLDTLYVSLDGYGAAHDAGRGAGVFERVRQNLARLERRRGRLVFLVTLSDTNIDAAATLPRQLAALRPDEIVLQPLIYLGGAESAQYRAYSRERFGCDYPGLDAMRRDDDAEYREKLAQAEARVSAERYPVPVRFMRHVADGPVCEKPWERVHVGADGEVGFCTDFFGFSAGKVLAAPLAEIWRGAAAERFRRAVLEDRLPICRHCPWRAQHRIGINPPSG